MSNEKPKAASQAPAEQPEKQKLEPIQDFLKTIDDPKKVEGADFQPADFDKKLQEWNRPNNIKEISKATEEMRLADISETQDQQNFYKRPARLARTFLTRNKNNPDTFEVNFKGYALAEWRVGLGDMFPPTVRKMAIQQPDGSWRTALRGKNPQTGRIGFFYEGNGEYAAVHSDQFNHIRIIETKALKSDDPDVISEHEAIYKKGAMQAVENEEALPQELLTSIKKHEGGRETLTAGTARSLLGFQIQNATLLKSSSPHPSTLETSEQQGRVLEVLGRESVFEKVATIPSTYKMMKEPVPKQIEAIATQIRERDQQYEMNDKIHFAIGDKEYIAEVAWHPPRATMKEWHRGVHVYEKSTNARQRINVQGITLQNRNTSRQNGDFSSEQPPRERQQSPEKKDTTPLGTLKALIEKEPDFLPKLYDVSQRLGCDPRDLLGIFWQESRLNPAIQNKTSGATGLIQFMPDTARRMWTDIRQIKKMSAVEQLDLVEQYLRPFAGNVDSYYKIYLAVFYPAALGKPNDFIIGSERSMSWARKVWSQNRGIDKDGDGLLSVGDFIQYAKHPFTNLDLRTLENPRNDYFRGNIS